MKKTLLTLAVAASTLVAAPVSAQSHTAGVRIQGAGCAIAKTDLNAARRANSVSETAVRSARANISRLTLLVSRAKGKLAQAQAAVASADLVVDRYTDYQTEATSKVADLQAAYDALVGVGTNVRAITAARVALAKATAHLNAMTARVAMGVARQTAAQDRVDAANSAVANYETLKADAEDAYDAAVDALVPVAAALSAARYAAIDACR